MSRILQDLSISTNVCLSSSRARALLEKGGTDLVILDSEAEDSWELLQQIWKGGKRHKPTVVGVSASSLPMRGAHVVLKKPVTDEAGKQCLKTAYSRMLLDYRMHARFALMAPIIATREDTREFAATVTDIGDGGIGLSTKEPLAIGDVLSFGLLLPGAPRKILVRVRILWTREFDRAGSEFLRIPPVDLMILHDWLREKGQVKKPVSMV